MTEWLPFHFSLSCIGEGNGNPLQCSCLENPRDGGAWWPAVYGVAQSRTRLKRLSSSIYVCVCVCVCVYTFIYIYTHTHYVLNLCYPLQYILNQSCWKVYQHQEWLLTPLTSCLPYKPTYLNVCPMALSFLTHFSEDSSACCGSRKAF